MEDFFQVGIITSAHGLRGEVKVYPTTDDVRRFKSLKEVIADIGGRRPTVGSGRALPEKGGVSGKESRDKNVGPVRESRGKDIGSGRELRDKAVGPGEASRVLEIESVKFFKQFAILKFRGIDSPEEAGKYRGTPLLVPRSKAVPLGRNEYYTADLMGLTVMDEDGTKIGVLREVLETGANDVYVIDLNDGRELLLPAIRQCVLAVDVEAGFIRIHILDGLL